jgi:hypothetical protein
LAIDALATPVANRRCAALVGDELLERLRELAAGSVVTPNRVPVTVADEQQLLLVRTPRAE